MVKPYILVVSAETLDGVKKIFFDIQGISLRSIPSSPFSRR